MNLSSKIKIIISVLAIFAWAGLFAVFYFKDSDFGADPIIDFGQIKGDSVSRFKIEKDEIILFSKRGEIGHQNDVLIISSKKDTKGIIIRVINDKILLFEQYFGCDSAEVEWSSAKAGFEVLLYGSEDVFWLIPAENKYDLIW